MATARPGRLGWLIVERITRWIRDEPRFADGLLALVFVMFEALAAPRSDDPAVFLALGVLLCAPIVLRRTSPVASAYAILLASIVSSLVLARFDNDTVGHPAGLLLIVALYSLVVHSRRWIAALYFLGLAADTAVKIIALDYEMPETVLYLAGFYLLGWAIGEVIAVRHRQHEEIAARLEIAETDRDRRAEDAVAAERTRIARELHDVVAHSVSVMIVQAEGASYAVRSNPDIAERALRTVASTGREALTELRRTLALLRDETTTNEVLDYGTAGLARTAALMRDAGLPVELEITGDIDALAPALGLGIKRIVQESLTNVLRHAGDGARATVVVQRVGEDVTVSVTDQGGNGIGRHGHGSGNGIVGMRERVAVLGGTLCTEELPGDGWRVTATLPAGPE
ncbi:sensor histidine kinase [Hoyosella sp. G463]|uniref:histidine kinase n=1 Tax=Lolliginicoccus lacisalsi TaxID=2742202 RepID=A0A927JCN0_9ACTN|nr:sensor histidine kinase [Lolliginicoccus lacisalsi]